MPQESRLEKFIKDFVQAKALEAVYLHLDDAITIRPVNKTGSISLVSFWAKALQHELSYPPNRYKYRRHVVNSVEHLVLETPEVKFSLNMINGTLTMGGPFIYDWFTTRFRPILQNFDPDFANVWRFVPTSSGKLPVLQDSVKDEYEKSETEAYLLMENRGQRMNSMFEEKLKAHSRDYLVDGEGDMSVSKPIWSAGEVSQQLNSLECGGNFETAAYIYPLWRSLLHHSFQEQDASIYISMPLLDVDRLREIIQVVLDRDSVAHLRSFYVNFYCDPLTSENVGSLQKKVLEYFDKQQQVVVEYKVFRCMTYPFSNLLSAFIAVVNKNIAKVFVTSANCHRSHLEHNGVTFAAYLKMSEKSFQERYLQPTESSGFVSSLSK